MLRLHDGTAGSSGEEEEGAGSREPGERGVDIQVSLGSRSFAREAKLGPE